MIWKCLIVSRNLILTLLMLFTYVLTAYTMVQLVQFLSTHLQSSFSLNSEQNITDITLDLLYDLGLLSIFLVMHSAVPKLKLLFYKLNIDLILRSIYVALSNLSLLLIFNYWKPVNYKLWTLETENELNWKIFAVIHGIMWFNVYGTALLFDLNELLGVKQIYNKMLNLQNPILYKSNELRETYEHLRHPSFVSLSLILLTYPIMTLDRFLIASVFIPYMYISWKVTSNDYNYMKNSFSRKKLA